MNTRNLETALREGGERHIEHHRVDTQDPLYVAVPTPDLEVLGVDAPRQERPPTPIVNVDDLGVGVHDALEEAGREKAVHRNRVQNGHSRARERHGSQEAQQQAAHAAIAVRRRHSASVPLECRLGMRDPPPFHRFALRTDRRSIDCTVHDERDTPRDACPPASVGARPPRIARPPAPTRGELPKQMRVARMLLTSPLSFERRLAMNWTQIEGKWTKRRARLRPSGRS